MRGLMGADDNEEQTDNFALLGDFNALCVDDYTHEQWQALKQDR